MPHHKICVIHHIQQAVRTYEEKLKEHIGISLNECLCLCAIQEGFCEPAAIARQLNLSPSRLSRILDNMECKELITRAINKSNRRNITVTSTKKGRELLAMLDTSDISFSLPDEAKGGLYE